MYQITEEEIPTMEGIEMPKKKVSKSQECREWITKTPNGSLADFKAETGVKMHASQFSVIKKQVLNPDSKPKKVAKAAKVPKEKKAAKAPKEVTVAAAPKVTKKATKKETKAPPVKRTIVLKTKVVPTNGARKPKKENKSIAAMLKKEQAFLDWCLEGRKQGWLQTLVDALS